MWNSVQCAVQGRSHVQTNTPCQDKTYTTYINGVQVIALADGAGSARLSHYGAESVTQHICAELSEKFDFYFSEEDGALVKQYLLAGITDCLNKAAARSECELKDLASTLLFVAIKDNKFMIAHIGDGVIGYLKNDELKIASQPENGEFVNTTFFTTSKDVIVTMKLIKGVLGSINGFVLMSDGTEASLYNKKENKLADVLKRIMKMTMIIPLAKVQEQLEYSFEAVIKQATTDDCSIVVMAKEYDNFSGYLNLSVVQKCEILKIKRRSTKKQIRRYDRILIYLQEKRSLHQLARYIHLKPKYTKKYVNKLCALNLIEKHGNCYQTILIMNK